MYQNAKTLAKETHFEKKKKKQYYHQKNMYFECFFFSTKLGTNMPKCMQSTLCGETEERETLVMSIF